MTPYQIFWQWLPSALIVAEQKNPGPMRMLDAIKRLKAIEGEGKAPGEGQTAYIGANDPYQAIKDYVSHVYGGAKVPDWLLYAERGY